MFKKYLALVLLFSSPALLAQNIHDELAEKLCECTEEQNSADTATVLKCWKGIEQEYQEEIRAFQNEKGNENMDIESFREFVIVRFIKNCSFAYQELRDSIIAGLPSYTRDPKVECEIIENGKFYYISVDQEGKLSDTTWVKIAGSSYTEYMMGYNTYSQLSIEWHDPCHFTLTFIKSNDPFKGKLSKPGDEWHYEIIRNDPKSLVLEMIWNNDPYHIEFIRTDTFLK